MKNQTINDLVDLFLLQNDQLNLSALDINKMENILQMFSQNMGLQPEQYYQWNFWTSVVYAGSLYTSIGYGNNTPTTAVGKVLTMIYAIVGIPLLLHCLSKGCAVEFICFKSYGLERTC